MSRTAANILTMTRRLCLIVSPKNQRSCSRVRAKKSSKNSSSSTGHPRVRPKIVAQVSEDKSKIIHGQARLKPGFEHWMIKFANSQDPRDIGAIEYAYSLMAKDAGIDMPDTHLFRTKKRGYFGVKRFDRRGEKRIHMHSLSV